MDPEVISKLLEVNRRFYNEFGDAFAATRRRIQPGISRILEMIPAGRPSDWLDLGCGSGALGKIWAGQGRTGTYTGMDFSRPLLSEAEKTTAGLSNAHLRLVYRYGDLMDNEWPSSFEEDRFDGVLAFASLHHIPGRDHHCRIFESVRKLLKQDGCFIFSVWQFQNSPKLMQRIQFWETIGLSEDQTEKGDTLLDWRFSLPENGGKHGLRYVHLFSEAELDRIADDTGFTLSERFYSDGAEGNLALYTVLRAV